MSNTVIGASVEVEYKSLGDIRKAIKQATSDLIAMQEQFGKTSPQAIAAAKKIAELKDRIEDAKEQADLFDPGKRFSAFANAANQVAAGFSAVQGAMALVGSESQDLQKTLAKVQGAIALSQGLSQLKDLGKAYDELKIVAVDAFSSVRKALMSVGIGLLVIALTAIIANWEKFRDAVFKLIPGLQTVSKFIGGLVTAFTDFVGITSEAERNLDKLVATNKRASETIDAQIQLLEAQGGKEDEIYKLKLSRSENELNVLRESLKVKGKLTEDELKQFRELKVQQELLDIQEGNRKKKAIEEQTKKQQEEAKKQQDAAKAAAQKNKEIQDAALKVLNDAKRALLTDQQRDEADAIQAFEERKKALQLAGKKDFTAIEKQKEIELAAIRKKYNDEELKKEEEFQNTVTALTQRLQATTATDEQEAARQSIVNKYAKEREEILKQYPNNVELLALLKKNEQAELAKIEEEYRQKKLQEDSARILEESSNEELTFEQRLAKIAEREQLESQLTFKSESERTAFQKQNSDARKAIIEAETQFRIDQAQKAADVLTQLSDVVGKETAAGKVMAIAAATINTYLAASKALTGIKTGNPLGAAIAIAQAAAVIATGIKTIREITKVRVPGGGGGGSAPAPATLSSAAPIPAEVSPAVQGQALNAQAINNLGNQATRAYVLNSDIQNNDQRNAYLQRNARIG